MKYLVFGTNSYVKKTSDGPRYCVIGALAQSVGIDFIGISQKEQIEDLLQEKEECAVQLRRKFGFKTSFMRYLQLLNDNYSIYHREYLSEKQGREKSWKALSDSLRKKNLYNRVKKYAVREVEGE